MDGIGWGWVGWGGVGWCGVGWGGVGWYWMGEFGLDGMGSVLKGSKIMLSMKNYLRIILKKTKINKKKANRETPYLNF